MTTLSPVLPKGFLSLALVLFITLQCISSSHGVAVMSVDFGSEWMKIAIVSPGVPMEIALNKESKRKTHTAIAFRDGERMFGEDAVNIGVRFPKNCYTYLLDLLGKDVNNPIVKLYQKRFPYHTIVPDPVRNTVMFQHDQNTVYSVEELVAMMLHKAHEIAQISANQVINEAVLTVPGYFNQAERKAMIQAAELADLKVLQLINDYTAVALNHGIFRRKDFNETAHYIMLFDMGASSTTATIVSYQITKTKEKGFLETNPQLSILGVGYDRTLGGLEMQLRLRDFLAKKFNEMKKTNKDVFKNERSMAKLFKEAGRVKNILSANMDHYAQVEGLIDEIDFRMQVTRDDFVSLCSDLFDRVKAPVEQALKSSGLTMDVISQVILVGAGTRVPLVQEKLSAVVGTELGKSLNTDEAAVLGAVYKAADLSAGFKVKKFITKDGVLFPIQVTFEKEGDGTPRIVKRILFGHMNLYPQKKILTFNKHQSDFNFNIGYGDLDFLPQNEIELLGSLNLSSVSLTQVAEALEKNKGPNVESKGIKAHFTMDESGLLTLINVELVLEKTMAEGDLAGNEESPLSKLGTTISKLFTGPEEASKEGETAEKASSDDKEDAGKEGGEKVDEKKEGEPNKTKEEGDKKQESVDPSKPKIVLLKEVIPSSEEKLFVLPLNKKQLSESQTKLADLNRRDEEKRIREGAMNALESFVFEAKAKLNTKEYKLAATSEEASLISEKCTELSNWLDEDAWDVTDASVFESKLMALRKLTEKVWARVKEHRERPEVLQALKTTIERSQMFLTTIKNVSANNPDAPESSIFTTVEIESLTKLIAETEEWMKNSILEQEKLPVHENPKITIKLIVEKISLLEREVNYLINKAKIWKPKEKADTKASKNGTDSSASGETKNETIPDAEKGKEEPKVEGKLTEEEPSKEKVDKPKSEEATPSKDSDKDAESAKHSEL